MRSCRLIDERSGKLHIDVHIGKCADQANRGSQRPCRLAVDDIQKLLEAQLLLLAEAGSQILPREAQRRLACARIAVAPGPQRDALAVCQLFDAITVEHTSSRIEEVDLN